MNIVKTIALVPSLYEGRSVMKRLHELEDKKEELEKQLSRAEAETSSQKISDSASLVREFVENFDTEFERVSQEERKIMLQKCIAGITIDRHAKVARFGVFSMPAVTPELEKALISHGNEGLVMTCRSARNRVHI
jgi:hypothetical protein